MRLLVALISLFTLLQVHSQVDLIARLDTNAIRIGEQTTLELEVSFTDGSHDIVWPLIKDTLQRSIEVVDPGVIDTFHVGGVTRQIQEITITAWDSGFYAVPPIPFTIDGEPRETEPFLLTVYTIQVDTTAAPLDVKPLQEEPFSIMDWLQLNGTTLAIVGGLSLLIGFLLFFFSQRKKKEKVIVEPIITEEAHVIAYRELSRMREEQVWRQGSSKQYFTRVTDVLRVYLEGRYGFQAMEQTTSEILEELRYSHLDERSKMDLSSILRRADMAKFAKEQSAESTKMNALEQAIQFIESTRPRQEMVHEQ